MAANPMAVIGLSYEALTLNTENTMQRLCAFLEVEYSSDMVEFHKSSEA